MTTLVTPMPGRKRAVLALFFRTGSRFETPADNGLSHFLEHMVFRGTEAHPTAHLLATAFEELGGTLDASTAADHGTLGINVPAQNLSAVIPLIAEVFKAPLLTDLEIERGVIREEVLEDLGEDGELTEPATLARSLAFGSSGLGQPITGPLQNVERFTQADIRRHMKRTHVARDVVISVAGAVNPDLITSELERAFCDVPEGDSLTHEAAPSQDAPRFISVKQPGSSQTNTSLCFRCPERTHPLEPAVEMMLRVIDDGMATRLYHRLCDSRGLCYSASGSYETYSDAGLVELEADAAHESAPEVLSQMLELTSELTQDLITEREFSRLRQRAGWHHEAYSDDPLSTAEFYAAAHLGGTAQSPQARLSQLLAVTREDIRAAAQLVFSARARNVICVGTPSRKSIDRLRALALQT